MEAVFYVMAIMGCGDGGVGCSDARIAPSRYATVQECQANLPSILAEQTDLSFPVVTATCRQAGTRVARAERPRPRG